MELLTVNPNLSREFLKDTLKVSEQTARLLKGIFDNRHLFHYRENTFDTEKLELVLADIHFPYQNKMALDTVMNRMTEKKYDYITLLGDTMDMYKASSFTKDPNRKSMSTELQETTDFLKTIRNMFPQAKIYYYEGNHEKRIKSIIWKKIPEISDLFDNLLSKQLGLDELNIMYVDQPFKIGKLWHFHGHERTGGSPEYITNVIMQYVYDSFIVGHFHRKQDKAFKRINGDIFVGASVGWLGDGKYIDYSIMNKYTNGFAEIEYDKQGRFRLHNYTIHNGNIYSS